jgi:hypothetical protein
MWIRRVEQPALATLFVAACATFLAECFVIEHAHAQGLTLQ